MSFGKKTIPPRNPTSPYRGLPPTTNLQKLLPPLGKCFKKLANPPLELVGGRNYGMAPEMKKLPPTPIWKIFTNGFFDFFESPIPSIFTKKML